MNLNTILLPVLTALICSALISFTCTPTASFIAYKIGAIDVPTDGRRMHKKPIPRLGGLAVFVAFVVSALVYCEMTPVLLSLLLGGLMIVIIGMIDDVFRIKPYAKLIIQLIAAVFPILLVTNAVNLIDGLDGLSCGVSAICSFSLLLVTLTFGQSLNSVLLCAILAGACLGFLPYNSNPAKIFIGDTGAMFLGYTMSVISISGVFKVHATLSFLIPMSIFGLPLFDTIFAVFRRLLHGQAPWHADRGHIHHKLIDLGFNQKQSVHILYAISGMLGLSALLFTGESLFGMILILVVSLLILISNIYIMTHADARHKAGLDQELSFDHGEPETPASDAKTESAAANAGTASDSDGAAAASSADVKTAAADVPGAENASDPIKATDAGKISDSTASDDTARSECPLRRFCGDKPPLAADPRGGGIAVSTAARTVRGSILRAGVCVSTATDRGDAV